MMIIFYNVKYKSYFFLNFAYNDIYNLLNSSIIKKLKIHNLGSILPRVMKLEIKQ